MSDQERQADREGADEASELFHRQVHPSFLDDTGTLSSQAFRPTSKDAWMLSLANGAMRGASEAFEFHTETLGYASAGTWSLAPSEIAEADLVCEDSPREATAADGSLHFDEAHCHVSMTDKATAHRKSKILKRSAQNRGATHRPVAAPLSRPEVDP